MRVRTAAATECGARCVAKHKDDWLHLTCPTALGRLGWLNDGRMDRRLPPQNHAKRGQHQAQDTYAVANHSGGGQQQDVYATAVST